jgi:aromatic ring-opening dioxygenase catalytic subunit (LigB family)
MREMFALTERELAALPARLPMRPKAVLMISGHWEAAEFSVSSAAHPGMEYDYFGFPPHTYQIRYPAPGSPALAARVQELLGAAGLPSRADAGRGLDHGAFVPMHCMYPQVDMPLVLLSLKHGYDPEEHFRAGQALTVLRDEGVLIMGSGLTYHDMRGFGSDAATTVAQTFEQFLARVVADPARRREQLLAWTQAPQARRAHPREDHLIPLMVAAGAAQGDPGRRLFLDHALKVDMGSYEFG